MNDHISDQRLWCEGAYIDGEWLSSTEYGTFDVLNPATRKILKALPNCRETETNRAISAAHRAWPAWRQRTAYERSGILRAWFELVLRHADDLAAIITLEEGKPLAEAKGEVAYAASFLEWFAEEAKRARGTTIPAKKEGQRILTIQQPVGVCAAITPWNFPAAMITRKVGPALAAGCTMVLKPAAQTPMTALALAKLAERAGVPKGVFNVVTGDDAAAIGGCLTRSKLVRKVTFTGSTRVGRELLEQSAATIKKCSMELGGNAPAIVFADCDPIIAIEGLLTAKFRNTGQSCIAANRILVQSAVYDELSRRLQAAIEGLLVGDGFEPNVDIGPLIDDDALTKIERHIADAVDRGARIVVGGTRHSCGQGFFCPTLLTDVPLDAMLAGSETFGPVAALFRFDTECEAVELANNTELGLAAYIFTRDAARIWRMAEALETGMVGVNTGFISNEAAPFGGVKQSGLGREGSHMGLEEYLEAKYICWDGLGSGETEPRSG